MSSRRETHGARRRRGPRTFVAAALALAVLLLALALFAGCTADEPVDTGMSDQDKANLASLGYVAAEMKESGSTVPGGKRVMVIGIDGMDYIKTVQLMRDGKLPHFKALADAGGFSSLLSSIPPQSPVAWSNFITGADPGGHGIFDFMHRDPDTYMPYLSISQVVPAPEKAKLLGFIPVKNKFAMPFTDYVFPLAGGATLNLRRGVAFWQVLEAAGVSGTVFKIPSNFPPVVSATGLMKSVSGMGTPDILGTYGTYSFYTTKERGPVQDMGGGYIYPVRVVNGVVEATLYGPPNDFKDYEKMEARTGERIPYGDKKVGTDFRVYVDPENPVAKLEIGDEEVILVEGEFSDWVEVEFTMVPGVVSVSGIARFYLKSTHPDFQLYVSPVNINPANQVLPITDPPEYGKELVDAVGYFYTQNMPEDTKALEHGVFGNDEFAKHSTLIFEERRKAFDYTLSQFDEGFYYFYFGSLDQSTHAMWRCMDPSHPAYNASEDAKYADFLDNLYMKFDDVLADAMKTVDENTTLIVLSDHGFAPWYREFHLNRWLYDEGYLVLKPGVRPENVEWLFGVDWSRTRAYGLGINGLYVNMRGREGQGIVEAGDAKALVDEIAEKLEAVIDPKNGQRAVVAAYKATESYHGPYTATAPDIVLGYGWGYRGSDETASGKVPDTVITDNTKKWSGDHCADYYHVPGVLFANKRIALERPSLYDLAPTILGEFGIAKRSWMVGAPVFD